MSRRRNPGALDRRGHATERAVAVGGRRRDVIGVARHAVADQLGIDLGAARLGVLVFFQHDDAGALAHDETVAVLVIGPRRCVGVSLKPVDSARTAANPAIEIRLTGDSAAARHHDVGIAQRDHPAGIADRMRAGRAGGDDGASSDP